MHAGPQRQVHHDDRNQGIRDQGGILPGIGAGGATSEYNRFSGAYPTPAERDSRTGIGEPLPGPKPRDCNESFEVSPGASRTQTQGTDCHECTDIQQEKTPDRQKDDLSAQKTADKH